jgi:hypothetical protein
MLNRPMLLSLNSVYPLVNLSTVASQHQLSSHPHQACTYLFHISPKIPAPLGILCSSQLALRAVLYSSAGPRFISVILLKRAVSDCWLMLGGGRMRKKSDWVASIQDGACQHLVSSSSENQPRHGPWWNPSMLW